jgi:hypothetical protein
VLERRQPAAEIVEAEREITHVELLLLYRIHAIDSKDAIGVKTS